MDKFRKKMIFKLGTPDHQRTAIQSVVENFRGMERNTYDNATDEDIRANYCSLSLDALMANINKITVENGKIPYKPIFKKPGTHVSKWKLVRARP